MNLKNNQKMENLQLVNSPYYVQYSENVTNAIKFAIYRDLLDIYDINTVVLNNYINDRQEIPLWIVEAACDVNLQDGRVPAQYQYLWFCLHNTTIRRIQPSGREFKTKVNFSTCYIELDEKIEIVVKKALELLDLPLYKFANLCGFKKS